MLALVVLRLLNFSYHNKMYTERRWELDKLQLHFSRFVVCPLRAETPSLISIPPFAVW
jgi:hypothetical protein